MTGGDWIAVAVFAAVITLAIVADHRLCIPLLQVKKYHVKRYKNTVYVGAERRFGRQLNEDGTPILLVVALMRFDPSQPNLIRYSAEGLGVQLTVARQDGGDRWPARNPAVKLSDPRYTRALQAALDEVAQSTELIGQRNVIRGWRRVILDRKKASAA